MNDLYVCYVDESGNGQVLDTTNHQQNQPILIITGMIVQASNIQAMTNGLLAAKNNFYPPTTTITHNLNLILHEIKGTALRKDMASTERRLWIKATNFVDTSLKIIEELDAKLVGKIYTKPYGQSMDEKSMYSSAIQTLATDFQSFLVEKNGFGIMILDSRDHGKNSGIAHSIFTQMFAANGNKYSRIIEMPTFGISDNHAGLQIADWICSAIIFPMAAATYLNGSFHTNFTKPKFADIKNKFASRIKDLQYRYTIANNGHKPRRLGGLNVSDAVGQKHGGYLFK